jgi:hypothetical protein
VVGNSTIMSTKTFNSNIKPNVYNPFGNSGQMVLTADGPISVDDFLKRERELQEWLRIKDIIEKHSIIEDLPDGDIIIRIKRHRIEKAIEDGTKVSPSDFEVDFGIDEDEK